MTRAALTKLLILVILAFIICLPEFFTLYRVSKVNFLCLPYRPCERGNEVNKEGKGKIGDADIRRRDMCDHSQTPGSEKWEQACTEEHQSNTAESDSRRGGEDSEKSWFMCETETDMAGLQSNMSSSALKTNLEVSVELQLSDVETLNLTLYGRSNHSSLHLHPPEEEEEEEKDDEGQKAFYCCFPVPPSKDPASQSHCLLWLANQTVLTATAVETLPWKRTQKGEWRCVYRVLWLTLLGVVMLTIVMIVLGQIYWRDRSCKKPKVPVGYDVTGHQLNDGERHTEIINPKGMILHSYGSQPWSGLSPIQEVDTQDDIETLLDGNAEPCYAANLHHRIHPSTSSLTEDQVW